MLHLIKNGIVIEDEYLKKAKERLIPSRKNKKKQYKNVPSVLRK